MRFFFQNIKIIGDTIIHLGQSVQISIIIFKNKFHIALEYKAGKNL